MAKSGPKPKPVTQRIRERVTITPDGCWEWQGPLNSSTGYGSIWVGSRSDGSRRWRSAHVASYEATYGATPDGLELDHLCRNRACCNPDHLEPVTHHENLMRSPVAPAAVQSRRTHCSRGHEFTPENTYVNKGKRYCRTCRRPPYRR